MRTMSWIGFLAILSAGLPVAAQESAGKQFLWQTNAYGDDVHVIDVATHKVVKHLTVGPNPHGIAAPDDASVVYVAIENFKSAQGELVWVNPRTYEITHRMTVGPISSRNVSLSFLPPRS